MNDVSLCRSEIYCIKRLVCTRKCFCLLLDNLCVFFISWLVDCWLFDIEFSERFGLSLASNLRGWFSCGNYCEANRFWEYAYKSTSVLNFDTSKNCAVVLPSSSSHRQTRWACVGGVFRLFAFNTRISWFEFSVLLVVCGFVYMDYMLRTAFNGWWVMED